MEHQVNYDEESQVLIQIVKGEYTNQDAIDCGELYSKELEDKPNRQLIVDLTKAGKMENRETRSVINEMINKAGITDVAYVGANSAIRMIAKVLMKLGNLKADSTFVATIDDAKKWIEKKR